MRRVSVALLAGAAIVAGALPAQAKLAGAANISGPGIGGKGISMRGDDGAGYPVISGLLEDGARATTKAPTENVGPRYTARYDIRFPKGAPSVVQYLYPFAEGGPLVYTPPGQEWIGGADGTAPSGWFTMRPELLQELQDRGLPETSPVAVQAPGDRQPQPAATAGPSGVVWGMVLLAGLLVVGALVGRRRAIVRRAA
jgi:hypothetical protein